MLPRIELLIFLFLENKTLRRCRCMCRYPEPEEVQGGRDVYLLGFPLEGGHRTQSISLSIGRGIDPLANIPELDLV